MGSETLNKRGSFVEITKVFSTRVKNNLEIPMDSNYKGWKAFKGLVLDFLNAKEEPKRELQKQN